MKKPFCISALLAAAILLGGCYSPQEPAWATAPLTHVCTSEQMAKAQKEAEWCNANTSYFSSYCYGSAIIRHCTPKEQSNGR